MGSRGGTAQGGRSIHRRPAAALLVLLPRAARTRLVPSNLGSGAPWFTCHSTRPLLPLFPEVLICLQQTSCHVNDHFFALLRADRLGAHLRVFAMLVMEHEYGNHAAAVLLIIDQLSPTVVPQERAPHEAVRPVIAVKHTVLVLQEDWSVDFALVQGPGDGVSSAASSVPEFRSPRRGWRTRRSSDISPPKTSR